MALSDIDQITALHKNNEAQFLCFRTHEGGELYAVNVFKVQEIIKNDRRLTLVDHEASRLLDGIITFRGLTVPLIDINKWFHYDAEHEERDLSAYSLDDTTSQVMLCDFSGVTVGIKIYKADRILTKSWDEIKPATRTASDSSKNKVNNHTRYIDGQLVQIVDIEKMVIDVFPFMADDVEDEVGLLERAKYHKKLLVAEDSTTAIKMLEKTLNKLGVEYEIFLNGGLLLERLYAMEDAGSVGLIITDLEMPEVSGFEVIKSIRSKGDKYAHVAIAVNSSMSGDSNRAMAITLGAQAFIAKTKPQEIASMVDKYCK
jgi:two-component system, chemotaxis family, chemotaxis protein CheV